MRGCAGRDQSEVIVWLYIADDTCVRAGDFTCAGLLDLVNDDSCIHFLSWLDEVVDVEVVTISGLKMILCYREQYISSL